MNKLRQVFPPLKVIDKTSTLNIEDYNYIEELLYVKGKSNYES